jgi:hypothetical protein
MKQIQSEIGGALSLFSFELDVAQAPRDPHHRWVRPSPTSPFFLGYVCNKVVTRAGIVTHLDAPQHVAKSRQSA